MTTTANPLRNAYGTVSATPIQNKKDELIQKWFADFNSDDEESFEEKYAGWELDAFFGNYNKQFSMPAIILCNDALNDQACDWDRFNDFFQEHLKLKK